MGRGLISGVLWGSVLALTSLLLFSQIGEFVGLVAAPTDVAVSAPQAGTSDAGGGAGDAPVAPDEQGSPATDPSRQGSGLTGANSDLAPQADTASAGVPDASNVAEGQTSPLAGVAPVVSAVTELASTLDPVSVAPIAPEGEIAPKAVAQAVAPPQTPVATEPPLSPQTPAQTAETVLALIAGPEVGSEPEQPQSPVAEAVPGNDFSSPTIVATPEPVAPEPEPEPEPVVIAKVEPEVVPEPEVAAEVAAVTPEPDSAVDAQVGESDGDVVSDTPVVKSVLNRGRAFGAREAESDVVEAVAEPEAEADTGTQIDGEIKSGPAIQINAQPFDNSEGRPLMAIVLLPTDESADGTGEQTTLPFPLSYVVDASKDTATAHMRRIRDAGNEVAMLTPLPAGATPKDVEIAFQTYMAAVPEAVAVIDVADAVFQSGRAVATQVAEALAASGHGMVTYSRGLNSATQVAERAGVPAALVFRVFDDNNRDGPAIRRFLDQAAFRAGQQTGVILVGHDRPETTQALIEWALGNRANTVALAPLSAVLLGQ